MNASTHTAFGWTDAYLVGFPSMDDTHREFVERLDSLFKATDAGIAERLLEMIEHSEHHFSQENRWMEETEFPARECHIGEHNAVLTSMREVLAYLTGEEGDPNEARRLAIELSRWFPSHTDYLDASLAQWVSKKKLGGVPIVVRRGVAHNEQA
jgi:hemerythrin-like metal-binding protein